MRVTAPAVMLANEDTMLHHFPFIARACDVASYVLAGFYAVDIIHGTAAHAPSVLLVAGFAAVGTLYRKAHAYATAA